MFFFNCILVKDWKENIVSFAFMVICAFTTHTHTHTDLLIPKQNYYPPHNKSVSSCQPVWPITEVTENRSVILTVGVWLQKFSP